MSEISNLITEIKEQVKYMRELGIDGVDAQMPEGQLSSVDSGRLKVDSAPKSPPPKYLAVSQSEIKKKNESRLSALPSLTKRPLRETTFTTPPASPMKKSTELPVLIDVAPKLEDTSDTIESIRAEMYNCTRCKLHSLGRKQIVHTTGNFQADLMFVGEAPGADEDEQGFPFVGRAGQLLTKIIEGIGLKREDVCIGNINRCRPPGNRQPEPDETAQCRPFILREIAVVKPKVIVVLGATAAHNLLQIKTPISRLRGNFQDYFGVKVMPTFHPAYLLRDPHKKREVWEDMKKVRDYLAET
jgi:DNA polymerase